MIGPPWARAAAGIATSAVSARAARREAGIMRHPLIGLSAGLIAFIMSGFMVTAHARDEKHSGQQMSWNTLNATKIGLKTTGRRGPAPHRREAGECGNSG